MDSRPVSRPNSPIRTVVAVLCALLFATAAFAAHVPPPAAARAPAQPVDPSTQPSGPVRTTFGDALAGLVNTIRTERGVAALPREPALDRAAAAQAAALALADGVAGDDTPGAGEPLRAAVAAAGWDAPASMTVARAYAVRRSLEQAADWLTSPDNPDGAALFDAAATALGAATQSLGDGRVAWVVVVAAGAAPPVAGGIGDDAPAVVAAGGDSASVMPASQHDAPPFEVTTLPGARGLAFGPALPDGAMAGIDPLAPWTPALQRTARIVVAVVVGLFVVTVLRLRGGDQN